jgi:two-component system chemotaxis response regulator CheB
MKDILNADPLIEVVGTAKNGQEAIDKVSELDPDVVTMDVEMPVMDGISAVKVIMADIPVPILMFSALTYSGAQATLEALEAGAMDFLPKRFEDITSNRQDAINTLRDRVKQLAAQKSSIQNKKQVSSPEIQHRSDNFFNLNGVNEQHRKPIFSKNLTSNKKYKIVLIGASTGGPVALQNILSAIPADFPLPILLVQHMPGTFTHAFAERLNGCCEIKVKEAEDRDELEAGTAYLAPGGKQMIVEQLSNGPTLRIHTDMTSNAAYKPCVDITFESVTSFAGGESLAIVLTGMGNDGQIGCAKLKECGATIWAQDEATSVVYGMPQAVAKAELAEAILPLPDITPSILKAVGVR